MCNSRNLARRSPRPRPHLLHCHRRDSRHRHMALGSDRVCKMVLLISILCLIRFHELIQLNKIKYKKLFMFKLP